MNAMPTAAVAGTVDVGGDLRVQPAGIRSDADDRLRDLGRSARSIRAIPSAALSR